MNFIVVDERYICLDRNMSCLTVCSTPPQYGSEVVCPERWKTKRTPHTGYFEDTVATRSAWNRCSKTIQLVCNNFLHHLNCGAKSLKLKVTPIPQFVDNVTKRWLGADTLSVKPYTIYGKALWAEIQTCPLQNYEDICTRRLSIDAFVQQGEHVSHAGREALRHIPVPPTPEIGRAHV